MSCEVACQALADVMNGLQRCPSAFTESKRRHDKQNQKTSLHAYTRSAEYASLDVGLSLYALMAHGVRLDVGSCFNDGTALHLSFTRLDFLQRCISLKSFMSQFCVRLRQVG